MKRGDSRFCPRPPSRRPVWAHTAAPAGVSRTVARIDTALQKYVDDGRLAGAVALVLRDGKRYTSGQWRSDKSGVAWPPTHIPMRQTKATSGDHGARRGRARSASPIRRAVSSRVCGETARSERGGPTVRSARRQSDSGCSRTRRASRMEPMSTSPRSTKPKVSVRRRDAEGTKADKDEPICEKIGTPATLPLSRIQRGVCYGYNTDIIGASSKRVGPALTSQPDAHHRADRGKDTIFSCRRRRRIRL